MAYVKQVWTDRQVQNPMTFTSTPNADGTITLTPAPGTITTEGNKITAERMNYIENGIYNNSLAIVPIGGIIPWAASNTSTLPTNFVLCNGQSLLRTTYSNLFDLIGTNYGSVDDTHFNVPNFVGKSPFGQDTSNTLFQIVGTTGGETTHKLIAAELPLDTYVDAFSSVFVSNMGGGTWLNNRGGGDQPHNNMPPYLTINFIIRVL